MADIQLKYNPYTKKVEKCLSNGNALDLENVFGNQDRELGEWALTFMEKMDARCNDSTYSISFEGIERDYNFLEDAAKEYMRTHPDVKISVHAEDNITPKQKFDELKKLFNRMQCETPFEELKSPDLTELFNKAMSSEFEMAVVATMSSGKSTLINAMLGRDLLPARNEATTANLARIHDVDGQTNFKAIAYNKDHEEIETIENATQKDMEDLNNRGNNVEAADFVSFIEVYGDIQGIESSNLQLVMTDTPGPNNSQNIEHQEHTYSLFKKEYKPMILYVLNASQLGTNDDNSLLRHVAEAMAEGGRQSQDRFIFALNKADEFDPERGEDIDNVILRVKEYLEQHKVYNPKIFPCDARSAKVFRQYLNGQPMTETEEDDILPRHSKIVKREWRHFSDKAPLSLSCRKQLNAMLDEADREADEEKRSIMKALVYTGVPAIELAISEYLSKYALPAKLTKGVDSFKQKIINLGLEANANKALAENKEAIKQTIDSLEKVEKIVSSGTMGKELASKLTSLNIESKIMSEFEKTSRNFNESYRAKVNKMRKTSIDPGLAREYSSQLTTSLRDLSADFKASVDISIKNEITKVVKEQVNELNKKIRELIGDVSFDVDSAGKLLGTASDINPDEMVSRYEHEEEVLVETRRVGSHKEKIEYESGFHPFKNAGIFLKNLFTGGEEVDDYEDVYKTERKVNFVEYIENEIDPEVEKFLRDTRKIATSYAKEQQERLIGFFKKEIEEIEKAISKKSEERQELLKNQEKFEQQKEQNEKNIEWLNQFNKDLDSILVI